jgi:hypothetical protein
LEFTKLSLSTLEQPWGVYVPLPKFLFFEEIQGILLEERTVEVFLSRVLRPGLDQSPFVGVVIPRPDIQTKE